MGYRLARAILARPLRIAFRIEVVDAGRLPRTGPVILAANHRSFMDSIFLAGAVPRRVSFLAKAEYFERKATSWAFRATGQIPLRRGSPAGARAAMQAALDVLARGRIVGVYPEGTRSRDGRLQRGRLGPVRLAVASGAPIVPVGLIGTEQVQAPGEALPHIGRAVSICFGPPMVLPEHLGTDRIAMRDATMELMGAIGRLADQDCSDLEPLRVPG